MPTSVKERHYTKKSSFPRAVHHALENNWESMATLNKHMRVSFKKINKAHYVLKLSNVIGNGFDSMNTRVLFKNLYISMRLFKDGRITLTLPLLYKDLYHYYRTHCISGVTPIVYNTQLLNFLTVATKKLNISGHLPGHHYQPEFSTNCDKFKMIANGLHIKVTPLATKTFEFGTECTAKRGYIINTISALVDFSAYLYRSEESYFGRSSHFSI